MNPFSYFGLVISFIVVIGLTRVVHANSVKDSAKIALTISNDTSTLSPEKIKKVAIRYLKKQRKKNQRLLHKQRKQVQELSAELEAAIADAIAKKIFSNRALIVGGNERAIGEGMSKRVEITREPNPDDYPYYKVPRAHKDLYNADVQLQQTIDRQATIDNYMKNPTSLTAAIRHRMATNEPVVSEKDWVHQQVDVLTQE